MLNCEPWHGQSQHFSNEFQWTWQPRCVHTAERRCSTPRSSRYAATLLRPSRMIAPWPGLSASADEISPGRTYSAKFLKAPMLVAMKFLIAETGLRAGE